MQFTRHITNWLILIAVWFAIAAAFLALQERTWWPLLFPLTGLAWTAAPGGVLGIVIGAGLRRLRESVITPGTHISAR